MLCKTRTNFRVTGLLANLMLLLSLDIPPPFVIIIGAFYFGGKNKTDTGFELLHLNTCSLLSSTNFLLRLLFLEGTLLRTLRLNYYECTVAIANILDLKKNPESEIARRRKGNT